MTELDALEILIKKHHPGWKYVRRPLFGGWQICFLDGKGRKVASAELHRLSLGNEDGLLEFWARSEEPIGSLSAIEALAEFEEVIK